MSELTVNDLESLKRSFITPEIISRAQLQRVDDEEGAEIAVRRRKAGTSYAGIVFPYFLPTNFTNPRAYRLRRDTPDISLRSDGTLREKGKYLTAPGTRNMLYFPPRVLSDSLTDVSLPIIITEGEKKGLALYRLATEDLTLDRWHFLPLAISGVWCFRGTIGKVLSANGNRVNVNGLLTDFELVELNRRSVLILFDINATTNPKVSKARDSLAKELRDRGANVSFVEMPDVANVNGIDDLLGIWEAESDTTEAIKKGLELIRTKVEASNQVAVSGTQSAKIIRLVEKAGARFFHTSERKTFITIPIDGHDENHEINSRYFRDWISQDYWNSEGKVPSAKALQDAIAALNGRALFASPEEEIFVRIAESQGSIYLDLADDQWQAIEISSDRWRVVDGFEIPAKFRRTKGMLPLPSPVLGGNVEDLSRYLNVAPEQFPLVAIWLLACFRPDKPFPVLILNGEQGSAKSTTSRVLRRLIDPNKAPLRSIPRDERDLMIGATNSWLVVFDNLSKIYDWLSDALCRLSTGGGFATRMLYQDGEETLFAATRPILLNGITELATRPDLLDRALLINCPNLSKAQRRDEETFWKEFSKSHSELLCAFLTALSATLANLPSVDLMEYERMADFEKFGVAAEAALSFGTDTFRRAYTSNRRDAIEIGMESSATATLVIAFVAERKKWAGTATRLLGELNEFAEQQKKLGIRREDLPKRANSLSGELRKVSPNLRANGIDFKRAKSGSRTILLQTIAEPSSESSLSTHARSYCGDDSDDLVSDVTGKDDLHLFTTDTNLLQTNALDAAGDGDDEFPPISTVEDDEERLAIMINDGGLSDAAAKHQIASIRDNPKPFLGLTDLANSA